MRLTNQLDTSAVLQARLVNAAVNNSVYIFRNEAGAPIGYIAWGRVSRETLNLVFKTRQMPSLPYEWNDGKIKLIFDVVLSKEWSLLARYQFFLYIRKNRIFAYYRGSKLVLCQHKDPRHNGYFWRYRRINLSAIKLIKQG